jgi:hypothetical protein
MTSAALKKPQTLEGRLAVTTEDEQRFKKSWNGLDGADERDDPYANLRYPFKVDLHKGKGRVLAGGVASNEMAGRSEQMPSLEPRGLPSTTTRALPAQGAQIGYIKQERSVSRELDSEREGKRPSEYFNATFPIQSRLTFAQLLLASSLRGLRP